MVQTGRGLTFTDTLQTLLHPAALVTVTAYVPAAPTVIQLPVRPVLHRYEAAPAGTHNCVDCPKQMEVAPVMVQIGRGFTVTAWLQTLLHPAALVTVTV